MWGQMLSGEYRSTARRLVVIPFVVPKSLSVKSPTFIGRPLPAGYPCSQPDACRAIWPGEGAAPMSSTIRPANTGSDRGNTPCELAYRLSLGLLRTVGRVAAGHGRRTGREILRG